MASGIIEDNLNMEDLEKGKAWPYMNFNSLGKALIIKLATFGLIWGFGFMNWNFVWLIPPIAYAVLKSERKKDGTLRRLTAQATALAKEKVIIENRIDDLPTWVYFPDYDRAEWLNGILYKLWPSVNHYARDLLKNNIEPTISECLAEYQKKIPGMGQEFCFGRIVLGRIPPKINGIKVYEKHTSRNEVVLDMDVMYAGDCDISFTMGNLKAGLKDFQLRGMLRVILKPLIPVIPIIGGVQAFFLNCPIIDFNLVGVADVLDLPGFSVILRKIITDQITANAVLPNKFSIPLSEDVPAQILKTPEPEGILRIHVVQAKHLMKKDFGVLGKGKSDPYAVITVGAQEFKTKTIDNTVDPKWDFWCECVIISVIAQQLTVQIWDFDDTKNDECLGRATIEVSSVKKKGIIDTWISLELAKHGMIHLRLQWLQLSGNPNDLAAALKETQELRVTSMSTAILVIYVDSAKNLPCLKGSKQPDVYLEASVGGKIVRTKTMSRSCNPVWEQGFTLLVINPETGTLHIKIHDEKTATIIGTLAYNLSSILSINNLEIKSQPFDLEKSGSESKVLLSMTLKILKYEEPEITSEDDDNEIQSTNKKLDHQDSTVSGINTDSPSKIQHSKEPAQNFEGSTVIPTPSKTATFPNIEEDANQHKSASVSGISSFISSQNASPGLVRRNPGVTSSAGEAKLGRIQLSMKYSISRQKLMITVHKIANLPILSNDPTNIPDPYVKLYLLPDRHKDTKRRTAVIKDNCNPVFDEQFEYIVSQGDINTRILELSICTQKGWLSTSSNCIGQVLINLSELDFSQTITSWYDFQPETKS